ncbi:MAG: hypothetical protein JNL70_12635 [Saprospiraceae bacterium]|nr:hypothetical protein [Saprospiraceae bacterium]
MKKLKWIFCLCLPLSIISCEKETNCNQGAKKAIFCTQEYQPVCGCNNQTYGNACLAEADGITQFTSGKCN